MRVAGIVGTAWSGSTLLSYLLGALPGVATCGEGHALITRREEHEQQGFACVQCKSWRCPVLTRSFVKSLTPQTLYPSLCAQYGKRLLVTSDKTPKLYSRFLGWDDLKHALVIFKRPEAYVWSHVRRFELPETVWGTPRERANNAARKQRWLRDPYTYLQYVLEGYTFVYTTIVAHARGSAAFIPYEAFSSDPEAWLHQLCTFLAVDWRPSALQYWKAAQHVVGGNSFVNTAPTEVQPDVGWRHGLSSDIRRYVEEERTALATYQSLCARGLLR